METLLGYRRAVKKRTLAYLTALGDDELRRAVTSHYWETQFTVDGLLWHVMIHEMRHTAQIAVLLRSQGVKPPLLDLLFYLLERISLK